MGLHFFVLLASSGMILVYGKFGYNLIQIGWGVAADTEVEEIQIIGGKSKF
jgi:hypothetical protein